ncbi:MAG: 16S rRNA (uracil(1498)-N(3))-methyltransferase [Blastocatellia bacterium]|nr:16S rRNA (uracil(1498)-N(3))-methyltransferase [Blastocatellia bacterium]
MRRFYAPPESFHEQSVRLSVEETRHLRNVLRLRAGETVNVFDGSGREFSCIIDTIGKHFSTLLIVNQISPPSPESDLYLTLAVALQKGEKLDLVVQKAVELGVSKLQPLLANRCNVRRGGGDKRTERWKKIALEAAKQSGRAKLMEVEALLSFENFIKNLGPAAYESQRLILFTEREGSGFSEIKPNKKITAVFGPEGGWEDSELALAREHGFSLITLGGRILRAETAAISVAAILQHRFGDMS